MSIEELGQGAVEVWSQMDLDYELIGKRIACRRKKMSLKQSFVEEKADIGYKYLFFIETARSIPSVEVIMRLAVALDTMPDEFLVGAVKHTEGGEKWRGVAELLRGMDDKHLEMARCFL